jgi:hypothetical protein
MKGKLYFIAILYLFFSVSGSLYSIGEKTVRLGGDSLWKMADHRDGIIRQELVRSNTVLMLSSTGSFPISGNTPDLALSFDEGHSARLRDSTGHYRVNASPLLTTVDHRYARTGSGAVLFSGFEQGRTVSPNSGTAATESPLVLEALTSAALFAPDSRIYDFTIEFWLHPLNMENGEQILLWNSSRLAKNTTSNYSPQQIRCASSRNRLQWSFTNFFHSPDEAKTINIDLTGVSAVVPRTWSHHLIRFDSVTGMIEYLVNGKAESIAYANSTGREGGEVFTPLTGRGGNFVLGGSFSGMMDEFLIYGSHAPRPHLQKYPLHGGRIETSAIDLGEGNNNVLKLEVSGGRTSVINERIRNQFSENGQFRFSDDSEMQFFIRASNNPYRWDIPWLPVTPGDDFVINVQGRYVQLAVDFYPSANGEASPYLEELCITYLPDEPPLPPAQLTAVAMDGAVELHWRNSPDQNTQGYLVYYGTTSDDYFGEDASLGASPIDAGKSNSIRIEGLKNGVLYFFRVAAYSNRNSGYAGPTYTSSFHTGEFSREVRARPLQGGIITPLLAR